MMCVRDLEHGVARSDRDMNSTNPLLCRSSHCTFSVSLNFAHSPVLRHESTKLSTSRTLPLLLMCKSQIVALDVCNCGAA